MKRNHYFILGGLLLFIIFGNNCGPQPEYGIKFDNETFNFGTRDEGLEISHTFTIINIGKQPVTIDVRPTCGCTVAENWDKTIAPGKKGKIPITFNTKGYQGDVEKIINVITNVPDQQTVPIKIKVKVVSPIAIIPNNAWLGDVNKESTEVLTGSFEIQNNLRAPLKILEITPPDKKTKVSITVLEENKRYKIDFTVDPPFEGEEVIQKQFTVKTDNKKHEFIYPSFSYFMPPPIQVFPNAIFVDSIQLQENEAIRSINVKSNMKLPIGILNLNFNGPAEIKYELEETTKDQYYLVKVLIPKGMVFPKDKQYSFTFNVLNDPKGAIYNVPIQVTQPL